MEPKYKEGHLVEIIRHGSFTLCRTLKASPPCLRECPVKKFEVRTHPRDEYKNIFKNLEGKIGLVVYVRRNRLNQPLGYRVLIEGHELFCKAVVAGKYFKLVGTQGDESR
jgi:hypothetical protein|tara:strand:+ start:984 stop:1313 length:330 start_codon:yes stop_codon:yes gene_type:complete